MRTLVTGSSGFVGQHIGAHFPFVPLEREGMQVDLRDQSALADSLREIKPEQVLHLAAQSFVPASFDDPEETFDINFLGTYNLLSALREGGFSGAFLYVSSGDVYGKVPECELPVTEARSPMPRNPYSVSKVAAEALCYQWSQTERMRIVVARPFNHVGPGQSARFVLSEAAQALARMKAGLQPPVLRMGDIDVTRDFVDVEDVVRAYEVLLERGRNGEIYNVCSGTERSIRGAIEEMASILGLEPTFEVDSTKLRRAEQRRMIGARAKLSDELGWVPITPWWETLSRLVAYWQQQVAGCD